LLQENTKQLWTGANNMTNGTAEAVLTPVFGRQEEYESIEKAVKNAAMAFCARTFTQFKPGKDRGEITSI
jgi:hypothetical protein